MDVDTLRQIYPQYSETQLAEVIAIYGDAAALQSRINSLSGFVKNMAQSALSQSLRMLADNVPPE